MSLVFLPSAFRAEVAGYMVKNVLMYPNGGELEGVLYGKTTKI